MGQGESKPAPSSTQHVFTSQTPVRFSHEIIEALQSSPESDSTRAKDMELHIQSRVEKELKRLEAEQSKALKELQEKLAPPADAPDLFDESPVVGRQSVQKEVDELRERLGRRKLKEEVVNDKAVGKAKGELVTCLRINDRKPLDCWREVDAFKREVGRLEKQFLGKVLD